MNVLQGNTIRRMFHRFVLAGFDEYRLLNIFSHVD
jgi:hypothetical protein